MLRRPLKLLTIAVTLLALAALTSPYWLGLALRIFSPLLDLEYKNYRRIGYTRFILETPVVRVDNVTISATRIEAETPVVWLYQKLFRRPVGHIHIGQWQIHIDEETDTSGQVAANMSSQPPSSLADNVGASLDDARNTTAAPDTTIPKSEIENPKSPAPTDGLLPLVQLLETINLYLVKHLPETTAQSGIISWPGQTLNLTALTWSNSTLTAQHPWAHAAIHNDIPNARWIIVARDPKKNWDASAILRGDTLEVAATFLSQPIAATAQFAPSDWLPETAHIEAPDWQTPTTQLPIPPETAAAYPQLSSSTYIDYQDRQLHINANAKAAPLNDPHAPPLTLQLIATVNENEVIVDTLHIRLPGLHAQLSAPLRINSQVAALNTTSLFDLNADLAQFPILNASGQLTGNALIVPNYTDPPTITTQLKVTRLRHLGIPFSQAEIDATLEWPSLAIRKLTLSNPPTPDASAVAKKASAAARQQPAASLLQAAATLDLATNQIQNATLTATLTPDILPKLPPEITAQIPSGTTFEKIQIDLTATGSRHNPGHQGTATLEDLRIPRIQPLNLAAAWQHTPDEQPAKNINTRKNHRTNIQADLRPQNQRSQLTANATLVPDQITLTSLTLHQDKLPLLTLANPAILSLSEKRHTLSLRSPETAPQTKSPSSLQTTLELAPTSRRLVLGLVQIPSLWLRDWLQNPLPEIQLETLALTADAPAGKALRLSLQTTGHVTLTPDFLGNTPQTAETSATAQAYALLNETAAHWTLDLAADDQNLTIRRFEIAAENAPVLTANATLPLTLHPGSEKTFTLAPQSPLAANISTRPNPLLWQKIEKLTRVTIDDPQIEIHLTGTPEKPIGTARLEINRIAPAPSPRKVAAPDKPPPPRTQPSPSTSTPRPSLLPTITRLTANITATPEQLIIAPLQCNVDGHPLTLTAELPRGTLVEIPSNIHKPRSFLNSDTTLHLTLPTTPFALIHSRLPEDLARNLSPAGTFSLELHHQPRTGIDGQLTLNGISTRPLSQTTITLREIHSRIKLDNTRATLSETRASLGGYPVTLDGYIGLPENPATSLPVDLRLRGENLPLVRSSDLLLRTDLDLRLHQPDTRQPPLLSGKIHLRDSLYLANIRSFIPSSPTSATNRRPPYFAIDEAPFDTWRLAVDITGDHFLRIRTPVLHSTANARLKLTGTLGNPVATGDITLDKGQIPLPFANFAVLGARATITAADPHEIRLNLDATGRRYGYDLYMRLTGTDQNPTLTFNSSPSLTSEEILLLVMTGEVPENDKSNSQNQRAAKIGAYLGQTLLTQLIGDPAAEERLSFVFGERVSRQGRETYGLEYAFTPKWSALGAYDEYDEYNIGLKYRITPKPKPPLKPQPEE